MKFKGICAFFTVIIYGMIVLEQCSWFLSGGIKMPIDLPWYGRIIYFIFMIGIISYAVQTGEKVDKEK